MLQNTPSAQMLESTSQQLWDLDSWWVGVLGYTSTLPPSGLTIDCRTGKYVQYGRELCLIPGLTLQVLYQISSWSPLPNTYAKPSEQKD